MVPSGSWVTSWALGFSESASTAISNQEVRNQPLLLAACALTSVICDVLAQGNLHVWRWEVSWLAQGWACHNLLDCAHHMPGHREHLLSQLYVVLCFVHAMRSEWGPCSTKRAARGYDINNHVQVYY